MSNIVLSNHALNGPAWKELDDLAEAAELTAAMSKMMTISKSSTSNKATTMLAMPFTKEGSKQQQRSKRQAPKLVPPSLKAIVSSRADLLQQQQQQRPSVLLQMQPEEIDTLEGQLLDILNEAEDLVIGTTMTLTGYDDDEQEVEGEEEQEQEQATSNNNAVYGFEMDSTWDDFCNSLAMIGDEQQEEEQPQEEDEKDNQEDGLAYYFEA